ncbi:MAG TPA: protealysin inhibitor emfourin [Nocardioidaceae bacterium]|nr:protealysin inhibitor emfourin [Nocardioidaceae bacterium]
MNRCLFVPPYLLERIAATHPDPDTARWARETLALDERFRAARSAARPAVPPDRTQPAPAPAGAHFSVYTADHGSTLPGTLVRAQGAAVSGDAEVDEAYVGVADALAMYDEVYGRTSYDDKGAPVVSTVHYEKGYDNAFWDGSQLVFGDGDGTSFHRFTSPIDVVGHELTHAVTQFTAGLTYADQPGALNESISDAFGSCLKQRVLQQTVDQADWLIGEGIFTASVQGKALRSMSAPGTAYDDPTLGKDPQVATMADYVHTKADNGGVHTNSGIPNRAFYLAATGIGGHSWDGAGKIWYAALTSGLGASTDFAGFAAATVTAGQAVSPDAAAAVTSAWRQVGVLDGAAQDGSTGGSAGADAAGWTNLPVGPGIVAVTRSGGFAGMETSGEVHLDPHPLDPPDRHLEPREAEIRRLVSRIDLATLQAGARSPEPDRFVYAFSMHGRSAVVGERDLTPELARLAELLLG